MEDLEAVTIQTYDRSAAVLAEYFAGIGSRVDIIERGLQLAGSSRTARVVEVGCGDGRDAEDILPRVGWYEGFDPSIGLINLAHKRLPKARFVVADALSYKYPDNLDAVFGFASYLHLDRDDFTAACRLAWAALRDGGVVVVTLKERDSYQEELVMDEFGKRMFYYYDENTVRACAETGFEVIVIEHQVLTRKTAKWLLVILRKKLALS
jgi:SAM-dependent methyltransferase